MARSPLETVNANLDASQEVPQIGDRKLDEADAQRLSAIDAAAEDFARGPEIDDANETYISSPEVARGRVDNSGRDAEREQDMQLETVRSFGRKGRTRPLVVEEQDNTEAGPQIERRRKVWIQQHSSKPYSQSVTRDVLDEGLGHISEEKKPVNPDGGSVSVAAAEAFVERSQALDAQGVDHSTKIWEVNAHTGQPTRGALDILQRDHPDKYEKASAFISGPHVKAISESGFLDGHKGKVSFVETPSDELPQIPDEDKPLVVIYSGAAYKEAIRVSKDESGHNKEIQAKTFINGDFPIIKTDDTATGHTPERIVPQSLMKFNTAKHRGARLESARKIAPRVNEVLPDPTGAKTPDLHVLKDNDDDVARFMKDRPKGIANIFHFAPGLRDDTEEVVKATDPHGLVIYDGPIRDDNTVLDTSELTAKEGEKGLTVRNVVDVRTIEDGARAADSNTNVFVPPRLSENQGGHTIAIVDRAQKEMRAGVNTIIENIVNDDKDYSATLVKNARIALAAEQMGGLEDGETAVGKITSQYNAYVDSRGSTLDARKAEGIKNAADTEAGRAMRGNALPELDADLARELASLLRAHGHNEAAIEFADRAIAAAPHVDALARTEKAWALIAISGTEQSDEQRQRAYAEAEKELIQARKISPHSVDVHLARVGLAQKQEQWRNLSDALSDIQNDAPRISKLRDDAALDPKLRELLGYTGEPVHENKAVTEAVAIAQLWTSVFRADEKALQEATEAREQALQQGKQAPAIRVMAHKLDYTDQGWTVVPDPILRDVVDMEKTRLALNAQEAASTIHRLFGDVAPELNQLPDRSVREILSIGERNRPYSGEPPAPVPYSELQPKGLELTGDAAIKAAQFVLDQRRLEVANASEDGIAVSRRPEKAAMPDGITFSNVDLDLKTGKRTQSELNLMFSDLARHMIVSGVTGSGKTAFTQNLAKEAVTAGLQVWVDDMGKVRQHDNLAKILHGIAPVTEVRFGDPKFTAFSLGLLMPPKGYSTEKWIGKIKLAFEASVDDPQEPFSQLTAAGTRNLLARYERKIKTSEGLWLPEHLLSDGRPNIRQLVAEVKAMPKIYGEGRAGPDVKGFLDARTMPWLSGIVGQALDSRHVIDVEDLILHHDVIHTSYDGSILPEEMKFLSLMFRMKRSAILEMMREEGGGGAMPLRAIGIYEEGESLFRKPEAGGLNATILAELENMGRMDRHDGYGVVINVQSINNIVDTLVKNASTKVIFGTQSHIDADLAMEGSGMTRDTFPDVFNTFGKLDPGEAMVVRKAVQRVKFPKPADELGPGEYRKLKLIDTFRASDGEPYTWDEVLAADQDSDGTEYDWWNIYAFAQVRAMSLEKPLPSIPSEMQRKYDAMPVRQRNLMLQTVVDNAVKDLGDSLAMDPLKLGAVITYNTQMALAGVPIGGQNPGKEFLSAPLAGASALQKLNQPFYDRRPLPGTYVPQPNIPGLEAAIASVRQRDAIDQVIGTSRPEMVRTEEMTRALGELGTAVNTSLDHAPQLQKTAMELLLGSDMGKRIISSIQRVTDKGPYSVAQMLEICKEMGMYEPGGPKLPWLAEELFETKQTIWSARKSIRQEAAESRQGAIVTQPAQQPPQVQAGPTMRGQAARPTSSPELSAEMPADLSSLAMQYAGELYDKEITSGGDTEIAIRAAVNGFIMRLGQDPVFGPRIARRDLSKFVENTLAKAKKGYTDNETDPRNGVIGALGKMLSRDD